MESKAKKQSKFMQFIGAPFQVLVKARDFYTKSMFDCAARIDQGSVVLGCHTKKMSHLPINFDVNSSKSGNNEDIGELIRAMSMIRAVTGSTMVNMNETRRQPVMEACRMGRKYYSAGVGKIGRIDEDRACDFEEEDVKGKSGMSCPRSRSYAVTKRNAVYY